MRGGLIDRRGLVAGGLVAGGLALSGAGRASAATVTTIKAEGGRDVRISMWPAQGREKGLILFSHGALSSPEKYERLLGPWSQAGFRILAPLHPDSTDHPDHQRYAMIDTWRARLQDMRALSAFAGADAYIAAGHSYGGLTALALGGASAVAPSGVTAPLRDPKAKLVVAFSPPGPSPGLIDAAGFATLAVPAFIQTGDNDIPFGAKDGRWQVHLAGYDDAPPGDKYALVLAGVDHYFGGLYCDLARPGPPQTQAFDRALALSIDFMDAYGPHRQQAARQRLVAAITDTGPAKLMRK